MLNACELLENIVVKFPGAVRIRRMVPGDLDSKSLGAVYQGSWEGGSGAEESVVGKPDERAEKPVKASKSSENMFENLCWKCQLETSKI